MQVAIDSMDAGLVFITVTGFSIPFGPQNYSLAVQACPDSPTDCTDSTSHTEVSPKICDPKMGGSARTMHASDTATQGMTRADLMSLHAWGTWRFWELGFQSLARTVAVPHAAWTARHGLCPTVTCCEKQNRYRGFSIQPKLGCVLQGNFSGWLESSSNPAWDGVSRTVCVLPVAAIAAAPPPLGNSSLATFIFASSDRARMASFFATCGLSCSIQACAVCKGCNAIHQLRVLLCKGSQCV